MAYKKTKPVVKKDIKVAKPAVIIPVNSNAVLLRPRITEKASFLSELNNVYTFEIAKDATKTSVAKAVIEVYKVKPIRVSIVNLPAKEVFMRGKKGTKQAIKKAMVQLKAGDKIEFV